MPDNIAKYLFSGRAVFVFLALILITGCVLRIRRYEGESRREVTGYYSLAVNLKETGVFAYPGSRYTPTAYRAPLYPAFLYPFAGEAAKDMRAAFFAQLALFLLAALLVWAAAGILTGSHAAALTAAAVYSFHPLGAFYSASFNVEFFYGFLVASIALAVVRAGAEGGGVKDWLIVFVLTGVSIGCKSPMALFPLLLAGWLYSRPSSGGALKKKLPALIAASYLLLVPWTARNAKQFGAFIPLERNAARGLIYTSGKGMPQACLPSVAAELYAKEGKGGLYSPGTSTASLLKSIAYSPGDYLKGFLKRLPMAFGTFPLLFIFSAAGLWLYRRSEAAEQLCLLAAYFTGVHLVFSFETHYLVPLLPVLSVLAAAPVRYLPGFSGQSGPFNERPAVRFILPAALCVILAAYALSVCLLAAETLKPGLKPLEADAVETLTAVVNTRSPAELAAYHNQKGVLKLFSRDYKSAKQDFISAINTSPSYPDPYLNLAYALRALGEPGAALSACRTAEEKCRTGPALGSILRCQEISLSVLGKQDAARAVAARRSALENRIIAELQK